MRYMAWLAVAGAAIAVGPAGAMLPAGASAPAPMAVAAGTGMCAKGEKVLFECSAGAKAVAVCAKGGFVQYRYGKPGKVELAFPAAAGQGGLYQAFTGYSGGGESQIGFTKGDYRYVVYSRTIRTNFDARGNMPEFSAGVFIVKGDQQISDRRCKKPADAQIDLTAAQKLLPEGEFTYPED